eukprot:4367956-Amphidinium_carterae.1
MDWPSALALTQSSWHILPPSATAMPRPSDMPQAVMPKVVHNDPHDDLVLSSDSSSSVDAPSMENLN